MINLQILNFNLLRYTSIAHKMIPHLAFLANSSNSINRFAVPRISSTLQSNQRKSINTFWTLSIGVFLAIECSHALSICSCKLWETSFARWLVQRLQTRCYFHGAGIVWKLVTWKTFYACCTVQIILAFIYFSCHTLPERSVVKTLIADQTNIPFSSAEGTIFNSACLRWGKKDKGQKSDETYAACFWYHTR